MATLGLSEAEREAIARLERDVIEPSMAALVILEFCTQASPATAKLVADYAAKGVKLVTIDVAKDKLIAAQFRVKAVPTVYAFFQGQPVADITSYRTEAQLKSVLDQLLTQLKVGETLAGRRKRYRTLVAMGDRSGEGDAPRAVTSFARSRRWA